MHTWRRFGLRNTSDFDFFNLAYLSEETIRNLIEEPRGLDSEFGSVHFVNAYTCSLASRDSELTRVLMDSVLICDSRVISSLLSLFSRNSMQFRGVDFMRTVVLRSNPDIRHFFLGSKSSTLESLKNKLRNMNPSVQIAGTFSPPFSDSVSFLIDQSVSIIKNSGANVVWVSLGTPKQDFFCNKLTSLLGIQTYAVGAAFDYFAGTLKEAPALLIKLHLEWLFRLIMEPRRLFLRYTFRNFQFILLCTRSITRRFFAKSNS